jgi:hypothetical protein
LQPPWDKVLRKLFQFNHKYHNLKEFKRMQ